MTPMIETERLILRGWCDGDVEPWARMNADPKVREFFGDLYSRERAITTATNLRKELERDGYGTFIVEVKDRMRFAGIITLREVPFHAHFTPANEIGWRFVVDAWGHGHATEAGQAALNFAFRQLRWTEIVAFTSEINVRSRR